MPNYADLLSIAADMQDKAVLLSGDSIAFLLTAMGEYLENHENWRGSGDFDVLTSEEQDVVDATIGKAERQLMGNLTGTIVMSAIYLDGALECNGATYNRVDYPELYNALWGTNYQIDEDTFKVPDFNFKFPLGEYQGAGNEGGEYNHALTITEMPAHTHVTTIPVDTLINGGLEAPAAAAITLISETGVEGGNEPHNNMPPYHTVRFFIWT